MVYVNWKVFDKKDKNMYNLKQRKEVVVVK